jgi:hypothetical protein
MLRRMLLSGAGGDSLEISISGYQFPQATGGDDADWLLVEVRASTGGRTWHSRDPSLQTFEVEALARWFEGIAHGSSFPDACDFVEPNLSFELVRVDRARAELRVYFELESRPRWAPAAGAGLRDVWVTLTPSRDEAAAAAAALRAALAAFPTRARAEATGGHGCGGGCCG